MEIPPNVNVELEGCQSRLRAALAESNDLKNKLSSAFLRHRPAERTGGEHGIAQAPGPIDDGDLVQRVVSAYRAANKTEGTADHSLWSLTFAERKRSVHEVLSNGDFNEAGAVLRNPAASLHFYGFDNLNLDYMATRSEESAIWEREFAFDNLLRLAEAVGVRRLFYPEAPADLELEGPETLLTDLDHFFGFRVDFPNPFIGEVGLATSRGVASYRAIQALYQAWRIREITRDRRGVSVLEIGAGLGRTAYYARQMGVPHYTIVDLPITAAAAAYFLGRVIGGEHLAFYGEERVRTTFLPGRRSKSISILPTQAFFEGDERFDLAVNVDSFTEMALPTASRYWRELEQRAAMICSINHEANHFTVKDLYGHGRLGDVQRVPCWMRRGYVEEIVRLPPDRSPLSDGVGALRGIRPALGRKSG